MKEIKSNCIGFTYYWLGLTRSEKYRAAPYLGELLRNFDIVENLKDADAIAYGSRTASKKSILIMHMGILYGDKSRVVHRVGCGAPIKDETIERFFGHYRLVFSGEEEIFLRLKK